MRILQPKTWSEREQVVSVILMAGLVIALLWYFLLLPQKNQRDRLQRDIDDMNDKLAARGYGDNESALQRSKEEKERQYGVLVQEWNQMVARMATFSNQNELAADVNRIAFKVELHDVQQRLLLKARDKSIRLPKDFLGIDDSVLSNEDARKLMLQLHSAEKVVDLMLDLKINRLIEVEPLPDRRYTAPGAKEAFLEEYPVRAEFHANLRNLYQLLHAILLPNQTLVLKNLRIEASDTYRDRLKVYAVLSALVFTKDACKLAPPPPPTQRVMAPMGA